MLSKEEIENTKIGLWNVRADILKAMQCSLADTSDKNEWQKEIDVIDNALKYIEQLEQEKADRTSADNYENSYIAKLESDQQKLIEKLEEDIRLINSGETLSIRSTLKDILSILKGE